MEISYACFFQSLEFMGLATKELSRSKFSTKLRTDVIPIFLKAGT